MSLCLDAFLWHSGAIMNFNGLTIVDKQLVEAARRKCGDISGNAAQLNEHLSRRYGASIWLKREDLSPVRSYKIRGAFNFLRKAVAKAARTRFSSAPRPATMRRLCFRLPPFRRSRRCFHAGDDTAAEDREDRIFGGEFISIRLVAIYSTSVTPLPASTYRIMTATCAALRS
ncbi:L-threonine dehydratase biosynthetic IlvA [Agrobacterium tumefaciens]|nr:L-threonine dehydratase biosynthetic IlvA [Agrobacterium tumefaciens]